MCLSVEYILIICLYGLACVYIIIRSLFLYLSIEHVLYLSIEYVLYLSVEHVLVY